MLEVAALRNGTRSMGKEKEQPAETEDGAVVSFQAALARREQQARASEPPPADLKKFQQTSEGDDYRHRMTMNAAGLAVVTLLILAGIWIADSLATMRKNQDCVLTGRRGCTPVDAPVAQRW
ncbi:MAG: hypothetical protein AB7K35_10045 [Pseudorhodoplanes sp.]